MIGNLVILLYNVLRLILSSSSVRKNWIQQTNIQNIRGYQQTPKMHVYNKFDQERNNELFNHKDLNRYIINILSKKVETDNIRLHSIMDIGEYYKGKGPNSSIKVRCHVQKTP